MNTLKAMVTHGQFLRIEKFAVKTPRGKRSPSNIYQVAYEAMRKPGFCDHIKYPTLPKVIFGIQPVDAALRAEAWALKQTARVFHKPTNCILVRKVRADSSCAAVGVLSVPPEWVADEQWVRFRESSVDWLMRKFHQDRLLSVVEHTDEHCLHLHFWVVPKMGERFSSVHQGVKALEDVGIKASRAVREAAYRKAMATLQDEFHEEVGQFFGLERLTLGRRRLTREQWHQKCFYEKEREIATQKRIDAAVARAVSGLESHDSEDSANLPVPSTN